MSVALLIITHAPLGSVTLTVATDTLGQSPLPVAAMDIALDADPQQELQRAEQLLNELDQGDGVLLFTDLYGSTPSNIACRLLQPERQLRLVTGLNLPMLIRTMNYAELPLDKLAEKALSGGHDGIRIQPEVAQEA
jgi:PTS system mannose-specific IIA component